MFKNVFYSLFSLLPLFSMCASAQTFTEGFVEGVPVLIQKSDWNTLSLMYIKFDKPIVATGCTSSEGVVVLDANESAKAALSFALAAQASGKKFRCYVVANQCSIITGALTTFPVCTEYPSIVN